MTSSIDDFLLQLGNPGRYQLFVFFVLCSTFFSTSFHINSMMFIGVTPKHHCKLPENWQWSLNESIPHVVTTGGVTVNDDCHLYSDPGNESKEIIPCPEGWTYLTTTDEWSIVRDWDLVCDDEYKVSLATTIFFAGMTVGCIFVGPVCDRLGRRLVLLSSLYAQLLLAMAIAFAPNYMLFVVLRFVLGIFVQSSSVSAMTLVIELFHWRYRATAGLFATLTFSLYLGIDTWISKQFTTWRHIQLVISLPSIATLVYFWFIPESFRWLISQHNAEQAYLLAKKYIHFNAISKRPNLRQEMEALVHSVRSKVITDKRQCHILGLFYTPKLRLISIINMFYWFITYLTYYHCTYYMVDLNLNLYFNFLISALTEFFFTVILILTTNKIGRRFVMITSLAATGILCLATGILANLRGDTSEIRMFLALMSKAMAISACNCLAVYTSELYPTIIRGLGIGSCAFWSRVSGIIGPQLVLLGSQKLEAIPFYILSILNIVGALSTFLLPETLNKSMPETFENVDDLWRVDKQPDVQPTINGHYRPTSPDDGVVSKDNKPTTNGVLSTQL